MEKNIVKLPNAFLRGAPAPKTYDSAARTMEVVCGAGTKGLRQTWFGDYYEELVVSDECVRMDRLNNGAPVLSSHDAYSLDSVLGVVERAKIVNGEIVCTVRFSESDSAKDSVNKILEGVVRKLSMGYSVYKYEELAAPEGEPPTFRAVDWEPLEVSFVAVPFDDQAQVRDKKTNFSLCEMPTKLRGNVMDKPNEQVRTAEPTAAVPVVETPATPVAEPVKPVEEKPAAEVAKVPDSVTTEAAAETVRSLEIFKMVETAGLPITEARTLIDAKLTVEEARDKILKRWAEKGNGVKTDSTITVGDDNKRELFAKGISNALLHRHNSKNNPITEEGRQFRGMTLIDMARDMVESTGVSTRGLSRNKIAGMALSGSFWQQRLGMQTTSDFPNILADVANKSLRQAYEQAPQTFRPFTRTVTNADYKNINRTQLGEGPALLEVGEHGETQYGTMGDGKETYRIKRYARIFAITKETLVNDDLDAFARAPQMLGMSAANLESDLVYGVILANANMGDGNPLFGSAHLNLGTPGVIGETTLGEMRQKGRLQKGLDGATLLNIFYKYLIVPAAKETTAQKQLTLVAPKASGDVNPFQGLYTLIVEPRLDANSSVSWYAAADYGQIDTLEIAYLDGEESVSIQSEIDFDTQGMKLRAEHAVGVKAIDWRGLFKNAGA